MLTDVQQGARPCCSVKYVHLPCIDCYAFLMEEAVALLEHFFSSLTQGPTFVTTAGIGFYLERMFEESEQRIVIVSPYIKMSMRIRSILLEKRKAGVPVVIVHRENFEHAEVASEIFTRNNLHAKCFLTEKAAILGSMNLYDYSQMNNDEMAIYLTVKENAGLYESVSQEVSRLCRDFPERKSVQSRRENENRGLCGLVPGRKYARAELKNWFSFADDHPGGIRQTTRGNIVLFCSSNSPYRNEERDGIIYYMGQNTGSAVQMLKYGNKALYDSFEKDRGRIFLFRDEVFLGECTVCMKPFQKDGKWIFPLKLRGEGNMTQPV